MRTHKKRKCLSTGFSLVLQRMSVLCRDLLRSWPHFPGHRLLIACHSQHNLNLLVEGSLTIPFSEYPAKPEVPGHLCLHGDNPMIAAPKQNRLSCDLHVLDLPRAPSQNEPPWDCTCNEFLPAWLIHSLFWFFFGILVNKSLHKDIPYLRVYIWKLCTSQLWCLSCLSQVHNK